MGKVAIYGAGQYGALFLSALEKEHIKIDFFIDDYARKNSFLKKPIKRLKETPLRTTIYISILQHSDTIEKNLKNKGYLDIINFTQSVKCIKYLLKETAKANHLWLVENKSRMVDKDKLSKVNSLFKDIKSKHILEKIIKLRETLDAKYYIDPSGTEYFPNDIPILENLNKINFIDCGAYIGDTINTLMQQNKKINYTISFEPDEKNYKNLIAELDIQKNNHPETNFIAYPAGVYSKNAALCFSNSNTITPSSAAIVKNSNQSINVVSLDSTILNSNPNYIKMDIEGAEKEAIIGATQTIQKHKPNLAVCLYHKPEDIWELPLLINSIEPSYDMYLRVHEDMCLSMVLYCIKQSYQTKTNYRKPQRYQISHKNQT